MPRLKHLTEYHKKALSLKYKGTEYSEIADTLNQLFPRARPGKDFTEPLVKNWFREGGTLCEEFRKYEIEWDAINKKLVLESKKAGIQTLGKNFRLACEMLVALMGSTQDPVKLGAIKEIIEAVLGDKVAGGIDDDDLTKYEQRLQKIRKQD